MADLRETVERAIRAGRGRGRFKKSELTLILGTDREIGREQNSIERRVGLTPDHVRWLKTLFADDLRLNALVLQGSGQRAGFADEGYIDAGAEIIGEDELQYLDMPPDVVHALKEPSHYEADIPGPFCRIGALHSADFEATTGLARLLMKGDVALFDGSNIGAAGTRRIPIRGRMSIPAGQIGAGWITAHLEKSDQRGRIVVVGAGNAGAAATEALLLAERVTELHLFDSDDEVLARARGRWASQARVSVRGCQGVDDPSLHASLEGSLGVVLAVWQPGGEAPKVVHVDAIKRLLRKQAIIVDISIDEKGGVFDPAVNRDWTAPVIAQHFHKSFLRSNIEYRGQTNMPRAWPGPSSKAHGDVVCPYIAALLYLSAVHGGAAQVVSFLCGKTFKEDNPDPTTVRDERVIDALAQDLRNGLAYYPRARDRNTSVGLQDSRMRILRVEDIVADRRNVFRFLLEKKIPFEFRLRPSLKEALNVTVEALAAFTPLVRDCLTNAFDHGVAAVVVCHPHSDGTKTRDAARALGVPIVNVLKVLIYRRVLSGGSAYFAAVVPGTLLVSESKLARHVGGGELSVASGDEVLEVTGYPAGAVPVTEIFQAERIKGVVIDSRVFASLEVYSSGGSERVGMGVPSKALRHDFVARVTLAVVEAASGPDALAAATALRTKANTVMQDGTVKDSTAVRAAVEAVVAAAESASRLNGASPTTVRDAARAAQKAFGRIHIADITRGDSGLETHPLAVETQLRRVAESVERQDTNAALVAIDRLRVLVTSTDIPKRIAR